MDGTIVDTEPYWMAAEHELVTAHGGSWSHEDSLSVVGVGLRDAAAVMQAHGVALGTDEVVQWMTDRVLQRVAEEVPWRPGARELLAELRESGTTTALVTMSLHRMAEEVVSRLGFDAFDAIVGGDDVSRAKPDPEPYRHAARLLGVDIADCLAIEDSVPGLASAVASGAVSIGIPLHASLDEADTHTLWTSLDGKTVADLRSVFARHRGGAASDGTTPTADPAPVGLRG
jgi:HAD superfamily hydrolase (TIGR01509 family)